MPPYPMMSLPARFLLSAVVFVAALAAAAPAQSVAERSRDGRRIDLTLQSGPHPWPGDYAVTVRLPPDYDASTARYPVLYIFDGGEFQADHDTLVAEQLIQPVIQVSIPNKSADSRQYDLTPDVWGPNSGGLPAFGDLIAQVLKPYVDAHFRTRPEAAATAICGTSYGGLAACWLGYNRPEVFGLAACHEPSLWWCNNRLLLRIQQDTAKTATRFWIMAADQEYPDMWRSAKLAAYALTRRGWREGEDVAFCQVHNYPHGNAAVRTQARSMLHFLFRLAPPELERTELTNCHGPQLVPLRPVALGGAANAYLDLHYRYGLRTTAIAPPLTIANPAVVTGGDPVLGELYPAGPGWTTVSAEFSGFHAVIDVQGDSVGSSAEPPARAAPPVITTEPVSLTIAPGGGGALGVTATGAGDLTYQWRRNGVALVGSTGPTLTFSSLQPDAAGEYTVIVSNDAGSTLSRIARLVVATPSPGRLVNVSVRGTAGVGGQPLIVGFVVTGGTAPMLIRGVGPELERTFGLTGVLANPQLELHRLAGGVDAIVGSNDDWATGGTALLAALFQQVGAFSLPADGLDAALVTTAGGVHTVHARGAGSGDTGVVLLEAYDTNSNATGRLVNVSARNYVGSDGDVLIAGFVIDGNVPKRLLVRGIGPALAAQGVAHPLADPRLELHLRALGRDSVVAANDNWGDGDIAALRAAATVTGAFPLSDAESSDAAVLLPVPAGVYTAVVSGVAGATGEALVEVYELP